MFAHRLLLLTEAFPPSVGGMQAHLAGLWGALPPAQSFVVAPRQSGDSAWDRKQPYAVHRVRMQAWWTVPRWRAAWQAARALVQRHRVEAVVCGKALFEGRAAHRLKAEFGVPYVVQTYAQELQHWLREARSRADLRAVLSEAARVLVINEPVKVALRSLGVPDRKVVKLYPGVGESFFRPPDQGEAYRDARGLRGKRVIVSVGRLVPRKGHAVLLAAFPALLRAVPGARLLIIGDGPERLALEREISRLGLIGAVGIRRHAAEDEVRQALATAEVFALTPFDDPLNPEGFGIAYLEAAAAGVPAVGSAVGGVPEAVQDGETGLLVPPNDQAATAEALIRLLTDDALRARQGAAARARADREFHWKGRALVFQGVVSSLLAEQRRPAQS